MCFDEKSPYKPCPICGARAFNNCGDGTHIECGKCQHRAVCKYMHNHMLIDCNKHCGGEHYKPQDGV